MGIKFIDPNYVIKVVSISDDAIDTEKSDLAEYQASYDVKHLKFLEGQVPTYFEIHNVGSSELVQIQEVHYLTEMPKILPGMSMEEMKNLKVKVTPVKTGEMLIKYFKAGCKKIIDGKKEIEVTDAVVDTVPSIVLQELGSFIMGRALLSEAKKK